MIRFRRADETSTTNGERRRGPRLVGISTVVGLTLVTVGKAVAATMVEYALLLVAVLLLAASDAQPPNQHGLHTVVTQLEIAAQDAAFFHLHGNRPRELAALGKTLGAANALVGLTSSCPDCGDAQTQLQRIIQLATGLKGRALQTSCNPDGVVAGGEECDPLANPDGCPIRTLPTFCNDDCQCAFVPSEPVPCDLPFPAECDAACDCQPIP